MSQNQQPKPSEPFIPAIEESSLLPEEKTSTQSIDIEPVQVQELTELADLAARSFTDAFGDKMNPDDLEKSLADNRSVEYFTKSMNTSHIWVAKQDDKIVGYVQFGEVLIPEVDPQEADRELGRLYIDTELQGQGIGTKLMDAALAEPEMAAAPNIYLQVWDQNTKALPLYEKYGFERVGVTHFMLGDNTPAQDLIMVRHKDVSEPELA